MTLMITIVAKDRIIQVSDRRLTKLSGEIHDENANKVVCVGMGYVNFATSYTGLAHIGRKRTDYWLLEHLGFIARNGEPSIRYLRLFGRTRDTCRVQTKRRTTV